MIQHSKTTLEEVDQQAVLRQFSIGHLTAGQARESFQERLAEVLQMEGVRVSTSGTMAFYRILKALHIAPEDEILLPDYICNTLINPIQALNAKVVTYDNSPSHWLSSPQQILPKVTSKTKVVVVNHTFGMLFPDLNNLRNALTSDIYLIEDCCHAISPDRLIAQEQIGAHSICCFYSFNATKYLATGEGGAIASNNVDFLNSLDSFSIGDNLSDLNCNLGIAQLARLQDFIARRNDIAQLYTQALSQEDVILPPQNSLFFRYPIQVMQSNVFWNSKIVAFRKGVDALLSETLNRTPEINAKHVMEKTVSIPLYPSLTNTEVNTIIEETLSHLQA